MHALSTAAADQVGADVFLRHPEAVPRQPLLAGGSSPFLGKEELPNVVLHDLGLMAAAPCLWPMAAGLSRRQSHQSSLI
jgi:hypothetical protein